MSNKVALYFVLIILLISCKLKPSATKQQEKVLYAASIGDSSIINLARLDSLLVNQIYDLRLKALNLEGSKEILKIEALNQNLTVNELVKKEVKKPFSISEGEIESYRKSINNFSFNKKKVVDYLTLQKQQNRHKYYTDSLKEVYNYKVKLIPPVFTKINATSLYTFSLNQIKSKNEVIIISDFDCNSCQFAVKKIKNILDKYNNIILFKFVYYSDYISPNIYTSCKLADLNSNFSEFHDSLFMSKLNTTMKIDLKQRNIHINQDDINSYMREAMINKGILAENKIYATPTFIVNN